MPCYRPIFGYRGHLRGASGKRVITFKRTEARGDERLVLPCGECIGCKFERSRQWAVRCMHESQLHLHNAFVTLTYDDEHLPHGGTLVKRDLQLFMKRLRKRFGNGVRFYACGEYGDMGRRPHYHLLLFGIRFDDQKPIAKAKGGEVLYTSAVLGELWPFGFNNIGDVTFESCAYVARYILKKMYGPDSADHYETLLDTGEIYTLEPEFTVMSRRPGIAAVWYSRFGNGVRDHDSVVINGHEQMPPRFYDLKYELLDIVGFERVKLERRRRAILFRVNATPDRLRVRELVEIRKQQIFLRRS
ncbi:replication initiator protein [robinz microvirus RP_92]|nr:replication initiator protein [robinz microvirus RP_92]